MSVPRAIAGLTVAVVLLGLTTTFGFWRQRVEVHERCEAFIHGYELLGEEAGAEPERIDRFVARLREETDC